VSLSASRLFAIVRATACLVYTLARALLQQYLQSRTYSVNSVSSAQIGVLSKILFNSESGRPETIQHGFVMRRGTDIFPSNFVRNAPLVETEAGGSEGTRFGRARPYARLPAKKGASPFLRGVSA